MMRLVKQAGQTEDEAAKIGGEAALSAVARVPVVTNKQWAPGWSNRLVEWSNRPVERSGQAES